LDDAILPSGTPPRFEFHTSCNTKFKIEISPLEDFSDSRKIKGISWTVKDPNTQTTLQKTLTPGQWNAVKKLIGTAPGYFRIKAWDGIKRETISEVRSFSVQ
jgi:hypothetical protein